MFHAILAPLLAFFSLFSAAAHTANVVDHTSASVIRVTGMKPTTNFFGEGELAHYACTGFMIEPKRMLTAAHCVGDDMTGDGLPLHLVKADAYFDLAVYDIDSLKTPLTLRDAPVERFEPVMGVGYGYGFTRLLVTFHKVVLIDYTPEAAMAPGIWVSLGYIGGMSGGPVVDADGYVIGVVQRSNSEIGYSVNCLTIHAFLLGTH